MPPTGIEEVWVNVQVGKFKSFIVGSIYKHPNSSPECLIYLEHKFQEYSNKRKDMYVLGDINEDYLKTNKLKHIVTKYNLTQLIKEPTRITRNSQTLLDVIITNNSQSILHSETTLSIADHHAVSCIVNLKKDKMKPFKMYGRCHKNYSPEKLQTELLKSIETLNQMYGTDNVDKQVNIFTTYFANALDTCAPFQYKTIKRPPAKWITDEIRQEIELKNQLAKAYKKTNDSTQKLYIQEQYNNQRRSVRKIISKAKRNFIHKQLKEARSDPKETWNIVKQVVPGKLKSTQHNNNFENPQDISEKFNQFFAEVGENTYNEVKTSEHQFNNESFSIGNTGSSISDPRQINNINPFKPEPVTELEVLRAISKLKNTKAIGHDQIALHYIKHSLFITIPYITLIINTSIVTKTFPKSWKHAIIIALHKSGEIEEPANFRPINLLTILSKILEKVVESQLMSYLETNNLLNPNQYAYRPKSSTEHALLNITDKIYTAIDKGYISLLVLLDLSKAFDSVNHDKLIRKLQNLHIETTWFKSYLSERTQSVKTGNYVSSPIINKYGVPQGSILGPILFLLFINDIPDPGTQQNRATAMTIYADDVQLLFTGKLNVTELKQQAEATLEYMNAWYSKNGLKLNANKTQCIIFGSPRNNKKIGNSFHITLKNSEIKMEDTVKNLGIWFDRNLTFKHHITILQKKLNGILSHLNRIKFNLDEKSRLLIVQALIFSNINYCTLIWGKCSPDLQYQIQKCKNFAAKVVCKGKYTKRDHVTPLHQKLQWININKTLILKEAIYMFKILCIPHQSNVNKIKYQKRKCISNILTRNSNDLHVPHRNTKTGTQAESVSGAKLWNQIPIDIKNSPTIHSFTTKMIQHLTDHIIQ